MDRFSDINKEILNGKWNRKHFETHGCMSSRDAELQKEYLTFED